MEQTKDFLEFAKVMAVLREVFGTDLTTQRIEIYFRYLSELSLEDLRRAVDRIIRQRRVAIFPTIGEILAAAGQDREAELELNAMEAWSDALAHVQHFDPNYPQGHADPVINRVIKHAFGNWTSFSKTDPKNESFDRRHFIEAYRLLHNKAERELPAGTPVLDQLLESFHRKDSSKKYLNTGGYRHA